MTEKLQIISLSVHHLSFLESTEKVMALALEKKPSYICFANVHMTIEAYNDKAFLEKLKKADLVVADGKPIASACKLLHHKKQERISGMDFTPIILEKANEKGLSVFIYGSTPDVTNSMKAKITADYPNIHYAGAISPPFKTMTTEETTIDVEKINRSGAHLVLIALGCPKQEKWMAQHSDKIEAVLLGIGGALPVVAGIQKRAPEWMQKMALEWLYRLFQQPGRLFKRYLYTNSYFLFLLGRAWIKNQFRK